MLTFFCLAWFGGFGAYYPTLLLLVLMRLTSGFGGVWAAIQIDSYHESVSATCTVVGPVEYWTFCDREDSDPVGTCPGGEHTYPASVGVC